jgi:hypothetical protein
MHGDKQYHDSDSDNGHGLDQGVHPMAAIR